MTTIHEKTADLKVAVDAAKAALAERIAEIQAACEHPTILKYTSGDYLTTRVCEECGYYERVQWDSSHRYKDQRLVKRAYVVSWTEIAEAEA